MNWLNIHTDVLRSVEYLGAEPIERATWLSLLGWCATQENGGVISNATQWNDRKWQQICGITKKEVETKSELYEFIGNDLFIHHYPLEAQTAVVAKREAGKKGGRPKKKTTNKPCGFVDDNHKDKDTKREVKTKGKERKGNGREGKENKESLSYILPYESEAFSGVWQSWIKYLKEKRKTPTKSTTQRQLNKLSKLNEKQAIETIERSIENGWQGLFPSNNVVRSNGKTSTGEGKRESEGIDVPIL